MIKISISIIIALAWYFLAGHYIAEKDRVEEWLYYFFLYVVGISWVIPFILSKPMYGPFGIGLLSPSSRNGKGRAALLMVGIFISLLASI